MTLTISPLIAHRGASQMAPENTLCALKKAAELGAKWVECDLQLTADGEVVIIHDETLDRTTNGKGEVKSTLYSVIQNLDAGSWFSPEFAGEKIPTLNEWLSTAMDLGLGVNLEIKVKPLESQRMAELLVESLKHFSGSVLISSFVHENLEAIRVLDSNVPLGFLCERWSSDYWSSVKKLNCVSVNLNYRYLNADVIAEIREQGLEILTYTVDDKSVAEKLFQQGVSAVFSNDCLLLTSEL